MPKLDSDIATVALIKTKAEHFLEGRANISRAFFKQAINSRLVSAEEVGEK